LSCDGLSNVFLEALNEFLDLFMDQTFHWLLTESKVTEIL
jgi:hypothetical protein